jgi:hypothetical protein
LGLQGSERAPGEKLLERSFSPDPFSRTLKSNYLIMFFESFEDS